MGGGNDTIGKHRRHHTAPDITHAPEQAPAPGKTTGIPIVDEGPLCKKHADKPGCFLDPDQRVMLMIALTTVVSSAMTNFQTALQNQRVRLLTTVQKSSTAWGLLAEVLFQWASSGLIGMLTKSVGALQKRAMDVFAEGGTLTVQGMQLSGANVERLAKIDVKHITHAAVQVSKGLRTTLKNAAHAGPSGDTVASAANVDKANFLTLIQDGIGPLTNSLVLDAPASMTDGEIVAMVAGYEDMSYHSVAAYEASIVELLDRYDDQRLASIGDGLSPDGGMSYMSRKQAVWVAAGTRNRLAIVEFYDKQFAGSQPVKSYDNQVVPWEQTEFVSWVDGDLAGTALDFQTQRLGAIPTLNATGGKTGMKEIDAWAVQP